MKGNLCRCKVDQIRVRVLIDSLIDLTPLSVWKKTQKNAFGIADDLGYKARNCGLLIHRAVNNKFLPLSFPIKNFIGDGWPFYPSIKSNYFNSAVILISINKRNKLFCSAESSTFNDNPSIVKMGISAMKRKRNPSKDTIRMQFSLRHLISYKQECKTC